jgi:hypothetical protein
LVCNKKNYVVVFNSLSHCFVFYASVDLAFLEESYDPGEVWATIRTEDINVFESFCVLCLKHVAGTGVWRQNYSRETISDAFTISDEAFAFLVLDNNRHYWKLSYKVGEHNISLVDTASPSGQPSKWHRIETKIH